MKLPNNLTFAIATAFATAVSITAVSNAAEAVCTATNTFEDGDYVEYEGGWTQANGRVFRVIDADTSTFTLEGLDTTDTTQFQPGLGGGSVRKVTTWVPIVQVSAADVTGGDGKTVEVPLLDNDMPVLLPDGFTATSVVLTIVDNKSAPHHAALKTISNGVKKTCLKAALPGGDELLYAGYCSFNESPSLTKGNVMAVKATLSLTNKVVRY